MSDQRLTQSPEKTKQRNARRESRPDSAPSLQGGIHPILQLQRTIGNRAVNRLLQSRTLQAKLTVSQPGDIYERKADRSADEAMRLSVMPSRESIQRRDGGQPEARVGGNETIPGPVGKVFRVTDRRTLIRTGPPDFSSTGRIIARGTDVEIVSYNTAQTYAEVQEHLPEGVMGPPQTFGWTAVSNLVEKHDISGYATTGTLSQVSWGETSGLYPARSAEYDPGMWDAELTRLLLSARRAVDTVGGRGEAVHRASPRTGDPIEQRLKTYHLINNFPALDAEIADAGVKWFYLSRNAAQAKHPGLSKPHVRVKSYGPFFNNGGGDVPRGWGVYLHFFKI